MTTVADLFTGLGGFTEGAVQAGAEVIFAANHWPTAIAYHQERHPTVRHECQDLQQFDFTELPDVDMLVGSPACQGHSTGGQPAQAGTGGNGRVNRTQLARRHQSDRATAWAIIAACDARAPRTVIVENVPRFTNWALFGQWLDCFRALGYQTNVQVLDAAEFGVAQSRKRAVITATLDRSPIQIRPTLDYAAPWTTIGDALENTESGWTPVTERSARIRKLVAKARSDAGPQCIVNNVGDGVRGRAWTDVAPTITTRSAGQLIVIDGDRCRNVTAREVARLQGFPDDYPLPANKVEAGRLIGNAIPVPLAAAAVAQAA